MFVQTLEKQRHFCMGQGTLPCIGSVWKGRGPEMCADMESRIQPLDPSALDTTQRSDPPLRLIRGSSGPLDPDLICAEEIQIAADLAEGTFSA